MSQDGSGQQEAVVYVPSAPAGTEAATAEESIDDAIAKLENGGTICLTEDIVLDEFEVVGEDIKICSADDAARTISKAADGEAENMASLSDGAVLTLEKVKVDASGNSAGRTLVATDDSKLILNEGASLENNASHGAVYLESSTIELAGGSITNNNAEQEDFPATSDGTRYAYEDNSGSDQPLGGAILMVDGSTLNMTDGILSGNSAYSGGAIYAWNPESIVLDGGTLSKNMGETPSEVPAAGGALCVDGNGDVKVTISGTALEENNAYNGGALYFGPDVDSAELKIVASAFSGNASNVPMQDSAGKTTYKGFGSIIYSDAEVCNLDIGEDSTFTGNKTGESGGIYLGHPTGVTLSAGSTVNIHDRVKFENNEALRGSCFYSKNNNGLTLSIADATFTNNQAQWAGVLYPSVSNSTVTLKNSTFKDNHAIDGGGGGVMWIATVATDKFTFEDCTFESNSSGNAGGVFGGYLTEGSCFDIIGCNFIKNESENNGGALSLSLKNSNAIINGGEFLENSSAISGGGFTANLDDGSIVIKGDALFKSNVADVNAGAFSVYRNMKSDHGTIELEECQIIDNVCNADFKNYENASDYLPTTHYNTGGIYIGENITLYMKDAEVTKNYVEDGFEGNAIGEGFGVCPHGTVELYPEHGTMIHSNGKDGKGMDILAVPWDETIDHEVPSQLYICDKTPDGKAYNWTDLEGNKARTGFYSWDQALKDKLDSEIEPTALSLEAAPNNYQGEDSLEAVGFKAHIDEPIFNLLSIANKEPKVLISGNHSAKALYGGGGVMVNGTVISGDFSISVTKEINVNGATDGMETELKNSLSQNKKFEFQLSIVDTQSPDTGSNSLTPPTGVTYSSTNSGNGQLNFSSGTITLDGTEVDGATAGTYHCIYCTFTINGTDTLRIGKINGSQIGIDSSDTTGRYLFLLEETKSDGASSVQIILPDDSGANDDGDLVFAFTCENTYDYGSLKISKTATGQPENQDASPFDFVLTLTDSSGQSYSGQTITYESADSEISVTDGADGKVSTDSNGKVYFKLAGGKEVTFSDIPVGTSYTVEEIKADGWIPTWTSATGTIDSTSSTATASAANAYTTGSLAINKVVEGDTGTSIPGPFSFNLLLKNYQGTPFNKVTIGYDIAGVIPDGGENGSVTTDENGNIKFSLSANQQIKFTGLPVGTQYEITEESLGDNWSTTWNEASRGSIPFETSADVTVTATNSFNPPPPPPPPSNPYGNLTVQKVVNPNGSADEDEKFYFSATFGNSGYSGPVNYSIQGTGAITIPEGTTGGSVTPVDGKVTFWLSAGSSITFSNLPQNLAYSVTEQLPEGSEWVGPQWTRNGSPVSGDPVTGAIPGNGGTAALVATNKPGEPEGGPEKTEVTPGDGAGVTVGQEVTYHLKYTNDTDEPVDVVIKDPIDRGLTFKSATNGGQYDPNELLPDDCEFTDPYAYHGVVTWTFKGVAPGQTVEFDLVCTVNENALPTGIVKDQAFFEVDNVWIPTQEPTNPVEPPDEPDEPDNPDNPDNPNHPDNPDHPVTPPDNPNTPNTPSTPSTPSNPTPSTPQPGTQHPSALPQTGDETPMALYWLVAALGAATLATALYLLHKRSTRPSGAHFRS